MTNDVWFRVARRERRKVLNIWSFYNRVRKRFKARYTSRGSNDGAFGERDYSIMGFVHEKPFHSTMRHTSLGTALFQ